MYINAMYLGMSNSGLPVFVFTLKGAFDTHAWSALLSSNLVGVAFLQNKNKFIVIRFP